MSKAFKGLKKIALSLSILIMMNIFFHAGISVFNPSAEYSDFCPDEMWDDPAVCEEYGGEWVVENNEYSPDSEPWEYCMEERNCWDLQQEANEPIERINFIVLVSAGILALGAGLWIALPSAVANGLMYGGVLSIIIGWIRAAQYLDNIAHFVISGIFFVLLVVLGVKKLKD